MKIKALATKKVLYGFLVLCVIVIAGVPSYYFYMKYQALLQNPAEASKAEMQAVTAQIGKLMDLPAGEEPSLATILDREQLKGQPFYERSQNGDKIIVYAKARKAILYRPSTKKIIDVVPLIADPSANPITIALYNGTTTAGLTNDLENEFKEKVVNVVVAGKENAKKTDYEKTLVIDLTGARGNEAGQLAQFLKGEVAELPAGEVKPEVSGQVIDILIIVGKNYTRASVSPVASPTAAP